MVLLACLPSSGSRAAVSDCSLSGTPAGGANLQLGSPDIPRDLPIGGVIPGSRTPINWTFSCASTGITKNSRWALQLGYASNPTAVAGLNNVYTSTTFPAGLGIRVVNASNNALPLATIDGQINSFDLGAASIGQVSFKWSGAIELIKVSLTPAAGRTPLTMTPSVPTQVWGNGTQTASQIGFTWYVNKTALTTCTVTNPTQTVVLPAVSQQALTGSGASAGATPFSIALNCQKGSKLYITLTDANNPTQTSNLLFPKGGLNGLSAVKISRGDGTRVSFGPDSPNANTTNQWLVGDTPDGILDIPFTASYQTYSESSGATFPIGSITVAATFTLSYQ